MPSTPFFDRSKAGSVGGESKPSPLVQGTPNNVDAGFVGHPFDVRIVWAFSYIYIYNIYIYI